jgi:phosphatidate cytidylyltransferase
MLFGVLLLMSCACQYEFYQMMKRNGHPVSRSGGMFMGVVWLTACYAFPPYAARTLPMGHQFETLVIAALVFALLLRVLFDARIRKPVEHIGVTLLGFFYLPFMLSFFIRLAQWGADQMFEIPPARVGVFLAMYLAAVVKFSDVGAFTVGVTMGRHKMFPRISPKKSWEGLAGGLAASMAVSVGMVLAAKRFACLPGGPLAELSVGHALALGAVLGAGGVLGDLVESMFKRSVNTKDSAGLLPGGAGGILDMFDSLTFTPAVLYFYLAWFVGQSVVP